MRRGKPPVYKGKRKAPVQTFPRLHWKKKKLLTVLDNRRQWDREFDPVASSVVEISTETGVYLILESSSSSSPNYYITE